jgi:hypothetical protein
MSFGVGRFLATPPLFESLLHDWSHCCIRRFHFALTPGRLRAGLTKKSGQFKITINLSMAKPLVGLMLHKIVSANQLNSSFLNMRSKLRTRLPLPDSGVNLRHWHSYLGERRVLRLHRKTKTTTKRPQAAGKKFLHRIMNADE